MIRATIHAVKRLIAAVRGGTLCRFCSDYVPRQQAEQWAGACEYCVRAHRRWQRELGLQWVDVK